MIYHRGTKGSYDFWAKLVGDSGFSWNSILPSFKKSMHFTPPNTAKRGPNSTANYEIDAYSPHGGPLQVSYPNYAMPFGQYGLEAMRAAGMPSSSGFSSGVLDGVTRNVRGNFHHESHTLLTA